MYQHTISFYSLRDFGQFICELDPWFSEIVAVQKVLWNIKTRHFDALCVSDAPLDKEHQIDIQGAYHMIASTTFNVDSVTTDDNNSATEDESVVPLNTQVGQDTTKLVAHYFPGSKVTSIKSSWHSGYFIGDYSIYLEVQVKHPTVLQVEIGFTNEDVPARSDSWLELLSVPGIVLFMKSITLVNTINGEPITYAVPGMYQKEINAWCSTHDEAELYGYKKTEHFFIIHPRMEDDTHKEELERIASQLA